jgi:hypothetical protein
VENTICICVREMSCLLTSDRKNGREGGGKGWCPNVPHQAFFPTIQRLEISNCVPFATSFCSSAFSCLTGSTKRSFVPAGLPQFSCVPDHPCAPCIDKVHRMAQEHDTAFPELPELHAKNANLHGLERGTVQRQLWQ